MPKGIGYGKKKKPVKKAKPRKVAKAKSAKEKNGPRKFTVSRGVTG